MPCSGDGWWRKRRGRGGEIQWLRVDGEVEDGDGRLGEFGGYLFLGWG